MQIPASLSGRAASMGCAFLGLLISVFTAAADDGPPLKIEGVKAAYSSREILALKLTNLSPRVITYGAGVLIRMDGKWTEFLTNIEDREAGNKAFMLRKLKPNAAAVLTWDPRLVNDPGSPRGRIRKGVFRFYIACVGGVQGPAPAPPEISGNIGDRVGKNNRRLLFSDEFRLRP